MTRECQDCGQPMLPHGHKKRPNEYDHAHGCPREPRRPEVIEVKQKTIRQVRRKGVVELKRWYVKLDFGGKKSTLAISGRAARWLKGKAPALGESEDGA